MLVAASTECFRQLPLQQAIDRLLDLEFTNIEIAIHEDGNQIKPSQVAEDLQEAVSVCRDSHRAGIVSYSVQVEAEGETHYEQFAACCRLAKATKVVTLTIPSAELGTPFNQEVEHLQQLVLIAQAEGVRVGMRSQVGRLSEDPDTVRVLCDNVDGLGLTLDPSHYICNPNGPRNYDSLMKYVYHVHLRDSTPTALQVRIGQGQIEYGRLVNMLNRVGYGQALSVHLDEIPGVDHVSELRKMRLLLESLM